LVKNIASGAVAASGRLMLTVLGGLAEFERELIRAQLIKTHLGDDLQEAEPIVKLLSDAIGPCERRNFLAHGERWSFKHSNVDHHDPQQGAME
jgi:hypothetical protein